MTDRATPAGASRTRWNRARSLRARDWGRIAEAAVTLAMTHVALRLRSPARVIDWATAAKHSGHAPITPAEISRTAWLAGVAGRYVVPAPCLTRAIALARLLARRGVAADIRVGVRTVDGRLDAHAWVELAGRPINDDAATVGRYAPFPQPLANLAALRARIR